MITEFPLLVFTTLTGIVAGAYVFAALFPNKETTKNPWLFGLVVRVACGQLKKQAGSFGRSRPALLGFRIALALNGFMRAQSRSRKD